MNVRFRISEIRLLCLTVIFLLPSLIYSQSTLYVDINATGFNNGTTWANAYTDLQSALDAALADDEIWVAAGTYQPSKDSLGSSSPADNKMKTFQLISDVNLFGGFSGGESSIDERNIENFPTILDGDLTSLRVFHVVSGASSSLIDGFTIQNGLADGADQSSFGGGMLNDTLSNISIRNCTFKNNKAGQGGGIANINSENITVENCYFIADTAVNAGAIGSFGSTATINNSVFHSNHASGTETNSGLGAAFYVWMSGTHSIYNSTFSNNTSGSNNGALHSRGGPMVYLYNCIVWGNKTEDLICSSSSNRFVPVYSCIEQSGFESGEGNVSTDPLLADSDNGYLNLLPGSSCIDAANGDNSTEKDIRGKSRSDYANAVNTGIGTPEYADIGAIEFYPIDAGIVSVDELETLISYSDSPRNIKITIENNMELTELSSLEIGWSIDGSEQTPLSWTGTLSANSTSSSIILGDYIFPLGTTALKFWISEPNGEADQNQSNDTLTHSVLCRTYDIGVKELVTPEENSPVGNNPVRIRIENFSPDSSLYTATIHWKVNDEEQADFHWTGDLVSGDISAAFSIGNYEFETGTYALEIWTDLPNGETDHNDINDNLLVTREIGIPSPISGIYTIGELEDFENINSAVKTLKYSGISGPVTFLISPGNYTEQVLIDSIPGSSPTNYVSFMSSTGDSTDVELTFDGTEEANYTLKLDSVSNITFSNMTISSTGNDWYSNVVLVEDGCENISFYNNHLYTVFDRDGSGVSSTVILIYGENNNSITITENRLENGNNVIWARGIAGNDQAQNFTISNNRIKFQGYNGINIQSYNLLNITDNVFTSGGSTAASSNALDVSYSSDYTILRNKIILTDKYNTIGGIRVDLGNSFSGTTGIIANNIVSILNDADKTVNGIIVAYSDHTDLYYNSIRTSGGSLSKSLEIDGGDDINIKNNIISDYSGGTAYNISGSISSLISDYNSVYSKDGVLGNWMGTDCNDMSTWQSTSSLDANSISAFPEFYSEEDLRTNSISMNNSGAHISDLTTDIEGTTRDGVNPDPGAYEFTTLAHNVRLGSLVIPGTGCGLTANEDIYIEVINSGTSDETDIPVVYTLDDGTTLVEETISGTLLSGDTAKFTFTNKADFSIPGEYYVIAYSKLANDELNLGDTIQSAHIESFGDISSFPFIEDFETGTSYFFQRDKGSEAGIDINETAAKNSDYGLYFEGGFAYSPWSSGPDSTNLWVTNADHHAIAYSCNVNVNSLTNPQLQFDLQTINSNYLDCAWFRVLVNDTDELWDISGERYFHSQYNSPYEIKIFDLSSYKGSDFTLTLQAVLKADYYNQVYLDNLCIGEPPLVELGGMQTICEWDSVTLDAGEGTDYSYAWKEIASDDTISKEQIFYVKSSGTYYVDVRNPDGMIATDTVEIIVNPGYYFLDAEVICSDDSLLWRGAYYKETGNYFENLTTVVGGCDSIYELDLTVHPAYFFNDVQENCDGDSILWRGVYYKETGSYYDNFLTDNGCDSIYQLDLTSNRTYFEIQNDNFCESETYSWRGEIYNESGIYYDTLSSIHGCDSVLAIELVIKPLYYFVESEEICDTDSLLWHETYYKEEGTYYDNGISVFGCDSIYELQLKVNSSHYFIEEESICSNESLNWQGSLYSDEGVYVASYTTESGCDSIYELKLTVTPAYFYEETATVCEGDSLLWHKAYYKKAGVYYDSSLAISGCDSIYKLQLNLASHYDIPSGNTICDNMTISWRGMDLDSSGIYYDSLTTVFGCDSIYSFELIVNETYYTEESMDICEGDYVQWNGGTYMNSGTYIHNENSRLGCDSILALVLSVHPKHVFTQDHEVICKGDSLLWRDKYFNEAGEHWDSLITMTGCDSIYSLQLQLNPSPSPFEITQNSEFIYINEEVAFSVSNGDAWNQTQYEWELEDGTITYEHNKDIRATWADTGRYDITVTATSLLEGNCPGDIEMIEVTVIDRDNGLEIPWAEDEVRIYPNPANEKVYIKYKEPVKVEIYDILGNKLLITEKVEIDISEYEIGTYFMKVKNYKNLVICIEKLIKY